MTSLALWSSPPTPVLPQWYFEMQSSIPLSTTLQALASLRPRLHTLGDLANLWEHRNQPLTKQEQQALVTMINRIGPPHDTHVVIPKGLSVSRLLTCPFTVRTLNCLQKLLAHNSSSSLIEMTVLEELSVGDLLRIPNFGLTSLLDLMCVVEAAQNIGYFQEPTLTYPYTQSPIASTTHSMLATQEPPEPPDPVDVAWESTIILLKRLLKAAVEINKSHTLLETLNGALGELAATLGMTDYLNEISLADLTGKTNLAQQSRAALSEFWESLSEVEQTILHKRMLNHNPLTLEELGETANLTRERIRQVEKRIESRLHHPSITGPAVKCWIGMLAILLRHKLGPITNPHDLDTQVSATFPVPDNPTEHNRTIAEMARYLLQQELGYSSAGDFCLSPEVTTVTRQLNSQSKALADDLGLLDEVALQEACLPNETWLTYWDALLKQAGLHRLSNHLALRDTSKARVKAALLSIGHPATKEEIGELCNLKPDRAGAQLSLLTGVVRADKYRWGLTEWVDDEYEGIPAEIIQRINEDGGSTRLNRLLEELPRMFGVAESSVKAYLDTPAFRIEQGWVMVANTPNIFLRRLEDVVDGYDDNGDPYWEFEIEDRHLSGYSLHGVPYEVATALGCKFDGKTTAKVRSPVNCQDISIIWRKTSMHGPEIGRLGPALRNAQITDGSQASLIIHSSSEVSLAPARSSNTQRQDKAHLGMSAIPPSFINQSSRFAGVKVQAPIKGRFSAPTSSATEQTREHTAYKDSDI